ncbi:DUF3598 family protein [Adonisia turfae]|uniref:DUF3598 family protein n=1 Tax=Adonisia turfae CCMR0081 TaxID=2292702 RepID=A0A6M0RWQ3_9CYAN|nr:DUF3598 family protein [Adonisia turfae]NEZ60667.1 DUF3598 family protein [Adonisia turfae CCMR0081]
MMETNWENFLKNLGEWQGSFTSVSLEGEILDSTPSILNLEGVEDNQLVKFRVRRFGSGGYGEPPVSDYSQEYRSLGKQVVFFETGAFTKGSLQLAPFSEFGAEYGFVTQNRRLRFVQLYDRQGELSSLTLIREFRTGTNAAERSPLTIKQLVGQWQGTALTVYSDWQPSATYTTHLDVQEINGGRLQQTLSFGNQAITSTAQITGNILQFEESPTPRKILLLPDGTSSNTPLHLKLRQSFFVELGWLVTDNERQRLIRNYNEKGEWVSATHVTEHRVK